MNSVNLVGRLARDPELKFVAGSGKAVATCSIAVDNPFNKDKKADFFNFVVWGKTAENLANYMSKGALIGLKGRLSARSYEGKDGQMKYIVEVVADNIEFLQRAGGKQQEQQNNYSTDEFQALDDDEDIPF